MSDTAVLIFELGPAADTGGGKRFGVEVAQVLQVFEPEGLTPVPLAPAAVLGIVNHHGRIVTVVDPGGVLGSGNADLSGLEGRVILLRLGDRNTGNLGVAVTRVHEIVPAGGLKAVDVAAGKCVGWVAQRGRHLINIVRVDSFLDELARHFGSANELGSRQVV